MRLGNKGLLPENFLLEYGVSNDSTLDEVFGLLGGGRKRKEACIHRLTPGTQAFQVSQISWGYYKSSDSFKPMSAYALQHWDHLSVVVKAYATFDVPLDRHGYRLVQHVFVMCV